MDLRAELGKTSTLQWPEPPNKGHVGDNYISSAVLSFVQRLPTFGGSKCIRAIGKTIIGTSTSVLCNCRQVYYTVSLSRSVHYRSIHYRSVHYRRFHCIQVISKKDTWKVSRFVMIGFPRNDM